MKTARPSALRLATFLATCRLVATMCAPSRTAITQPVPPHAMSWLRNSTRPTDGIHFCAAMIRPRCRVEGRRPISDLDLPPRISRGGRPNRWTMARARPDRRSIRAARGPRSDPRASPAKRRRRAAPAFHRRRCSADLLAQIVGDPFADPLGMIFVHPCLSHAFRESELPPPERRPWGRAARAGRPRGLRDRRLPPRSAPRICARCDDEVRPRRARRRGWDRATTDRARTLRRPPDRARMRAPPADVRCWRRPPDSQPSLPAAFRSAIGRRPYAARPRPNVRSAGRRDRCGSWRFGLGPFGEQAEPRQSGDGMLAAGGRCR